jgi:DNA-binding MarR family transcriptional regulator
MPTADLEPHVATIRRFNRFYTKQIGLLDNTLLDTPFSLTQSRLLYELGHRDHLTASDLGKDLGLDAGYLSRMLRAFEKDGLIKRRPSNEDGRRAHITLTDAGRKASDDLDQRAHDQIAALLAKLAPGEERKLLGAMATIDRAGFHIVSTEPHNSFGHELVAEIWEREL